MGAGNPARPDGRIGHDTEPHHGILGSVDAPLSLERIPRQRHIRAHEVQEGEPMSKASTGSAVASASAGFPFGTIALVFWLAVHYGCALGTTWGGISVHVAAYWALVIGVVIPAALCLFALGIFLIVVAMIAVTK
jgi:hypothetical protein